METKLHCLASLLAVPLLALLVLPRGGEAAARLSVQGKVFKYHGDTVFLSGGNLPWIYYGYDFGENQWQSRKSKIEEQIRMLSQAGGNSIRVWIHIQGETTPHFSSQGYVTGPDSKGSLLNDIKDLLDTAKKYNVFVFPTLWNCAVDQDSHHRLDGLIVDTRKLQSYIDKVLKPMVHHVAGHPALGAWDIINEPEGMLKPDQYNSEPCFDTTSLKGSGAGWAGQKYSFQQLLRFINLQADAIHSADRGALVTIGAWNPKPDIEAYGQHNHYSDACLKKAGGKLLGTLDFYQVHSYSWQGRFSSEQPFKNPASAYHLDKPIVVGEFWEQDGGHMSITQMFTYLYQHGYNGAWSWDLMNHGSNQRRGMQAIKDMTSHGKVAVSM